MMDDEKVVWAARALSKLTEAFIRTICSAG
jgi:hypothetical protein